MWATIWGKHLEPRIPLFLVFVSGLGFSIQVLTVKKLSEHGIHQTFEFVFVRGIIQLIISSVFISYERAAAERAAVKGPDLFGDTSFVKFMMFVRSFVGFGGIAFSFLAVDLLPIGDSQVLVMLSPLWASALGYFVLGEKWRLPEFFAVRKHHALLT